MQVNRNLIEKTYINKVCFNQNYELILISTNLGFEIFTTYPIKSLRKNELGHNVNLIESYYNTNLIFLTGDFFDELKVFNKIVVVYDDHKEKIVGRINNELEILNIKVSKEYVVFCDKKNIYCYDFHNLGILQKYEYFENEFNINFSLSVYIRNYLITLIENNKISIINLDNNSIKVLSTNKNAIQYFNLSKDGQYLATSSGGDKIKIFDIKKTSLVRILKRGSMTCNIKSINFCINNSKIIVSSDLSTIHIFLNFKEYDYKISKPMLNRIAKYFDYDLCNYDYSYNRVNLKNGNKICCIINNKFLIFELIPECKIYSGEVCEFENKNINISDDLSLCNYEYYDSIKNIESEENNEEESEVKNIKLDSVWNLKMIKKI